VTSLRLITAGESHGPAEVCVLEGIPAGLRVERSDIDEELSRRQGGYGRGGRMAIESDRCTLLAGVRHGVTLGSPICVIVENKDHANWAVAMSPDPVDQAATGAGQRPVVTIPRPGHADLAGAAKYGHRDLRNVFERASARETVGRVAAGAICKLLLREVGVTVRARVVAIGQVSLETPCDLMDAAKIDWEAVEESPVGCENVGTGEAMCRAIDGASAAGESLGGVVEVWCWGACPGVGSYASAEKRLDGRLMGAIGSIPAIKAVELGLGTMVASRPGSQVHDEMVPVLKDGKSTVGRTSNRAGGLEGGVTNGMPVVVRAYMKPIPTLTSPLASVDLSTMDAASAHIERSDVCAVPAARVVVEAAAAIVLAGAYLDKFGGDSVGQMVDAVRKYEEGLEERGLWLRS
jgi:chorismate synthase